MANYWGWHPPRSALPQYPYKHTDITFLSVHTISACGLQTQDSCPSSLSLCLAHRGRIPARAHSSTCAVQSWTDDSCPFLCSCTQYAGKENHNKPTLFFFFSCYSSRGWFFLLNLHQSLDTKLERLKKHLVFLLYLCQNYSNQGKKFSYSLQNSWHTMCRDVPIWPDEFL